MNSFVPKEWSDIDCQFPNRYKAVDEELNETYYTMYNAFGQITEQGDVFDAETMNNLEARIDAGFDGTLDTLTGTENPTPLQGKNGDFYIKLQTLNYVTTVTGFFVKVNDEWLQIPISGGGES